MIRYGKCVSIGVLLVLCAAGAVATETPLFDSSELLDVTITAPLGELLRDLDPEPKDRPAKLQYTDNTGVTHTFDIGVRQRGKTRRAPDLCKFPPLRINFKTKTTAETIFAGQDKLKLVTHCQDNRKLYQQYVLQEYLVYKILNLLTEQSFKTRLLNVTYVSTDSKRKPLTSYAFLIEDRDRMAARSGYSFQEPTRIERHELNAEAANLIEIFQYLIGNTDWSMLDGPGEDRCCHNTILIANEDGAYVPVPYDFDYSGIINTPYALPASTVRIKSVRVRAYRGFCRASDLLEATLERYREQQQAIYELYAQQAGLTPATVNKTTKYFDDFYKTINDPRRLERQIVRRCR